MKKHKYILLIIGIFLIVFLLIIYFNNQQDSQQDFKNIRIHEETKKILQSLDDKVYINIYLNGNLSPQCLKLQDSLTLLLNNFKSLTDKEIDWSFVEIEEKEDKDGKIYSPLIGQNIYPIFIKDNGKSFKTYPYATIHYKEKKSLPIVLLPPSLSKSMGMRNDIINELSEENLQEAVNDLEYNFIEAIYLLKQNKKKKIAFLEGHQELERVNTHDIRNTLSKYYEIDYLDLTLFPENTNDELEKINNQMQRINQYQVIIIAKPRKSFHKMYKYLIDQYIMNGGRIMWLLDGTNAANIDDFDGMEFIVRRDSLLLNDLLSNYGAKINHDLIQDEVCSKNIISQRNNNGDFTSSIKDWRYNPILSSNTDHIINTYGDSILTHFVSSIKILKPDKITVLLSSSNKSNLLNEGEDVSLEIIENPPNTFEGKKTIAILIEDKFNSAFSGNKPNIGINYKEKSSRNKMIIISDGDIIKNEYIHESGKYGYLGHDRFKTNTQDGNIFEGNTTFILTSIQYLCDDEGLIKIRHKTK
mgnify:CR=1 FL=1